MTMAACCTSWSAAPRRPRAYPRWSPRARPRGGRSWSSPRRTASVETEARTSGTASPAACAVRTRVYDTTAALLSRVDEPFLASAAADPALSAAGQSGDPLLAAASAWRMSYMITGRNHPREALDLAMAAVTLE